MTDEQKVHILSKMTKCKECGKWKFNSDLKYGSCATCSNTYPKSKKVTKARKSNKKPQDKSEFTIDEGKEAIWLEEQMRVNQDIYVETIYMSLKELVMRGLPIRMALDSIGMSSKKFYEDVPKSYRDRLKELKKAKTVHMNLHAKRKR